MQVTVISLLAEEKLRLAQALKEQVDNFTKSISSLEREKVILEKCKAVTPSDAPREWLVNLEERINTWKASTHDYQDSINKSNTILNALNTNDETPIKYALFVSIYNKESNKKSIEAKYKYYPRLKKAKEKSLYVFANKIKAIMEAENVRFA